MNDMTLEHLVEQKAKYQDKADYFKSVGFDGLAAEFQGMADLIGKMEEYIKERENGTEV
jgi:hypothetical protein